MQTPSLPQNLRIEDGVDLTLRRPTLADFDICREFLHGLSFGTRYFRFGSGGFVYPDHEIRRLLTPDPAQREHILLTKSRTDGPGEVVIASARYERDTDASRCEFGIIVLDGWQHHGLGQRLMETLIELARDHGIAVMYCRVLGSNRWMIDLARRLGFGFAGATASMPIKTMELALHRGRSAEPSNRGIIDAGRPGRPQ